MLSRAGGAVLAHAVACAAAVAAQARVCAHAAREPTQWRRWRRRHDLARSPKRALEAVKEARRPKPGAADDEGEGELQEHAHVLQDKVDAQSRLLDELSGTP